MAEKQRILIVDDDENIAELISLYLMKECYETKIVNDGEAALKIFPDFRPNLILLDLMLPGISGEEVLQEIRKQGNTPVIILTAKDTIDDKVEVLQSGADDYVTKPFDIKEVLARVAVQIRRMEGSFSEGNLVYQGLELDRENFCVRVDQTELPKITRQEFSILELLLKHPKKVFSKEEIFEYAWEEAYMGETKTLDVHISNIRKKIKSVTSREYIETIWGIGYRLHP